MIRSPLVAVANETLRKRYDSARARWVNVDLSFDTFAHRLAELVDGEPDFDAAVEQRVTDDLYLAWACLEEVPGAVLEFERAFLVKVPGWVRRVVRSDARADEVRQEVAKRLLVKDGTSAPRIALYAGRGPLGGWVRVSAMRVAHNIRASQHSLNGVPFDAAHLTPDLDAEVAALRKLYAKQFADALRLALDTLERDERTALRLHYLDGLTIEEVGAAYRVSRATAARMLARAREGIATKMRELLASELGSAADGPTFLALIRDELEDSLARRLSE